MIWVATPPLPSGQSHLDPRDTTMASHETQMSSNEDKAIPCLPAREETGSNEV
jgi:hypothetical protein